MWQQLDRDLAAEPGILRQVDLSHSARAYPLQYGVMAEHPAWLQSTPIISQNFGRHLTYDWPLHEVRLRFVGGKQVFDFPAQRVIPGASLIKKSGPLGWSAFQPGCDQFFDALPTFGRHKGPIFERS
jgi:hypothetical protein